MSKISFKTKAISTLLSLLLILQLVPLSLFAATMPTYSGALALFNSNLSGDGYEYDASTKTLTITEDGLHITSSEFGICTDVDHLTIILNGDLYIDSNDAGIESYALTITGDGSLYVTSANSYGIGVYGDLLIDINNLTIDSYYDCINGNSGADITVNGNLNLISSSDDGFYVDEDFTLTVYGNASISAGDDCLEGGGSYDGTFTFYGDLYMKSEYYGIYDFANLDFYVYGDAEFDIEEGVFYSNNYSNLYFYGDTLIHCDGGYVDGYIVDNEYDLYIYTEGTMTVKGEYGFYVNDSSSPLVIDGTGTIDIYVDYYAIAATGTAEIKGSVTVNATTEASYTETDTFTIADTAAYNGVYYVYDNNYIAYVSGDFTPVPNYNGFYDNYYNLYFLEGSTITIDQEATIDWSCYTIDYTNANIINNGWLILPNSTIPGEIAALNFAGAGAVEVDSVLYDNAGNLAYNTGDDIMLDDSPVSTDYYTWDQNADGVWVFTALTGYFNCDIYIAVDDAIISLDKNVGISGGLFIGYYGEEESYPSATNLTITGDYTFAPLGILYNAMGSEVTIDAGTTVIAIGVSVYDEPIDDLGTSLVVNGNFISDALTLHSLTVNNGGTVELEVIFLYDISDATGALILGDNTAVLIPENGVLVSTDLEMIPVWTFTTDGQEIAGDLSNIATYIYIGAKPVVDDGSTDTDADADDTESDLADTGVDTNIAFVIALMLTSLAVLVKTKKAAKAK